MPTTTTQGMRFHWSLPTNGVNDRRRGGIDRDELNPIEDLDAQRLFCQRAEELEIGRAHV